MFYEFLRELRSFEWIVPSLCDDLNSVLQAKNRFAETVGARLL